MPNVSISNEVGVQKRLAAVVFGHVTSAEAMESLFIQEKVEGATEEEDTLPLDGLTLFGKQWERAFPHVSRLHRIGKDERN